MYGVLYKDDDGAMVFRLCDALSEVRYYADNIACMGNGVTVFEFKQDENCYVEQFAM